MHTATTNARTAGLLYLAVIISGIFSLAYVPSQLLVDGSAQVTVANLQAHQQLFRLGIVAGILCYLFFLFLPPVLYRLLRTQGETTAQLMLLLGVISVPMYLINVPHQLQVLSLLHQDITLSGMSPESLQNLVMLSLDRYEQGMRMVHLFSGLWLFPLGLLVYRLGGIARLLGLLLILGCPGYLLNMLGPILYPAYRDLGIGLYLSFPATVGEIGICIWLLVNGFASKVKTDQAAL